MTPKNWIMAARPKTLTAALVPILVGTSLAYTLVGSAHLILSLFAFLSAVFIQIGTNLINDALDFKKGADTAERQGPVRVTQSGLMTPAQVGWGGFFCFLMAIGLAIPLVVAGGKTIVVIGLLSLLAGYLYTGSSLALAYTGLGDLFVLIFFGWVAVGGVYFLHSGTWNLSMMIAATQVGLLATVLIAINNLRDYQTDQKVSKRTLAVRFGPTFARCEITVLCFMPFIAGVYWLQNQLIFAFVLPLLMLPIAVRLVQQIWTTSPGRIYNQFLGQGALLHLSFGVLLSLGILSGR